MKRKLLTLILSICMLCSVCPMTVLAAFDDVTAPVVTGVSMNAPGATVTAGDELYFSIGLSDESDLESISLDFKIEGVSDGLNLIGSKFVSYDTETGVAQVKVEITDDIPNGAWYLCWIFASDVYGNSKNYYSSDNIVGFDDIRFAIASTATLPTSVSIPETLTVSVCDVYTIRPVVEPITSIPEWTWISSDTGIVEIHSAGGGTSANVTGVAPGTATITGVTSNGLAVSCEVTVVDAPPPIAGFVDSVYHIDVDTTIHIVPTLTPDDATTLYEVTSDNPHVVAVGTAGGHTSVTITGINPGTATITIRGRNNLVLTTTIIVGDENDVQHEKVTVEAVPATCTREGRTSYIKCSACRYHFTEPETIPMTDHEYGEWYVYLEPTATEDGVSRRDCENCSAYETDVIPATGEPDPEPEPEPEPESGPEPERPVIPDIPAVPHVQEEDEPSIDIGGETVDVKVDGEMVGITVSDENVSNIIEEAAESGVVELDVSGLEDASGVSVPQNLIDAINESEDVSALSITTSTGSMELSADALGAIASAMENENDSVKLEINTIDAGNITSSQRYPVAQVMNSAVFVDLSATIEHKDARGNVTGTSTIHQFYGDITISVPLKQTDSMQGRQIIACYFADDGSVTYFPAKYENGIVTFTTNHYSTFGVFASRAATFTDIDLNEWYMSAAEYITSKELMNGVGGSAFAPNSELSRAMLTQILYNMEGRPAVTGSSEFSDVADGEWYTDAVIWASANGIVGGYGDGRFGPNDPVTREQMATILYRYEQSKGGGFQGMWMFLLDYPDREEVSEWAYEAVCWMTMNGIINGIPEGDTTKICPAGTATRAQVAQTLMNFMTKT